MYVVWANARIATVMWLLVAGLAACGPEGGQSGLDAEVGTGRLDVGVVDAVGEADAVADGTVVDAGADDGPVPDAGPPIELDWVELPGGAFEMGSDEHQWSQPVRAITLQPFELTRTEVTVAQYRACVTAGACSPIRTFGGVVPTGCELTDEWADHPVICINRAEARIFAGWVGARLPSEAKWEYAARGGGLERDFPWGDEPADCQRAIVPEPSPEGGEGGSVMWDGCSLHDRWPVCSRQEGNTVQGLCDMIGNASEWVEDDLCDEGQPPTDGASAVCGSGVGLTRGGHWGSSLEQLGSRTRYPRQEPDADSWFAHNGFRLARTLPVE